MDGSAEFESPPVTPAKSVSTLRRHTPLPPNRPIPNLAEVGDTAPPETPPPLVSNIPDIPVVTENQPKPNPKLAIPDSDLPVSLRGLQRRLNGSKIEFVDPQTNQVVATQSSTGIRLAGFEGSRTDYVTEDEKIGSTWFMKTKNPETGETVAWLAGASREGASGTFPDPELADLATADTARAWVEKWLLNYESAVDDTISQDVQVDFVKTIYAKIPNYGGNETYELALLTNARIKYHNTGILARYATDNFGEAFGNIGGKEHQKIIDLPGLLASAELLKEGEGSHFRLGGADADANKALLVTRTKTLSSSRGTILTDQQAELAVNMALKCYYLFGEAAYYDGLVDKTGKFIKFETDTVGSSHYQTATEKCAEYFEEHWDDIDFDSANNHRGSLTGSVAGSSTKGLYYFPVTLEKDATAHKGQAKSLRKFAYLWVTSLAQTPDPTGKARGDILEVLKNAGVADYTRNRRWAAEVSNVSKNRAVFADKNENESLLDAPFVHQDQVMSSNVRETMGKALENYSKACAAFLPLPTALNKEARTHLLKGLLGYVNSKQAKDEGFHFLPWNDFIINKAILIAFHANAITHHQAVELQKELKVSIEKAAWIGVVPATSGTISQIFKQIWKGIIH